MAETCHTPNIVDQQRSSPSQRGGKGRRVVKENRLPKRRRRIKENRLPKEKIVERTPIVDQQTSTSDHAGGGRREVKRNSLPGEKTGERTPTGLQGISFTSRDSFRRSRSGRVLLPPLEFWRNQVPIYDAERKIAGIQEGIDLITEPGGAGKSYVRKRQAKR